MFVGILFCGAWSKWRSWADRRNLLCLVSAWIAELTYVAKLLPLYGGGPYARSTWPGVWNWWLSNPAENLRGVVMAPVWVIYALLIVFSVLLAAVTAISVRGLMRV